MKMYAKGLGFLAAVLMTAALAAQGHAEDMKAFMPEAMQQNGIVYLSGGVGLDERDAMKTAEKDYNLIVSNANKGGHLSADITFVLKAKGGKEVLMVQNAGPLFYARLPAGTYSLEAMNGDQVAKRRVTIRGSKSAKVYFIWSNGGQCANTAAEAPGEAAKEEPKGAVKHKMNGEAKKAPEAKEEKKDESKAMKKDEKKEDKAKDVKKNESKDMKEKTKDEKKSESKDKTGKKDKAKEAPKDDSKTESKDM